MLATYHEKFPDKSTHIEHCINILSKEMFILGEFNADNYPSIRDPNDIDVLANAIVSDVEILITGDKDFNEIKALISKPKIMSPTEYRAIYMEV